MGNGSRYQSSLLCLPLYLQIVFPECWPYLSEICPQLLKLQSTIINRQTIQQQNMTKDNFPFLYNKVMINIIEYTLICDKF